MHHTQQRRVVSELVIDNEEHTGTVQPESSDDRHDVAEVRNSMTESGHQAGETDVEDGLQDDDRDDKDDTPCDRLSRWHDDEDDDHDSQSRNEVKKVSDDCRNGQCGSGKLKCLDHRGTRSDRPGATCHAL